MAIIFGVTSMILLGFLAASDGSLCSNVGGKLACDDICDVKRPGNYNFSVDFIGTRLDLDCVRYKGLKTVRLFQRTFCRGKTGGMDSIVQPWNMCFFNYENEHINKAIQTLPQEETALQEDEVVAKISVSGPTSVTTPKGSVLTVMSTTVPTLEAETMKTATEMTAMALPATTMNPPIAAVSMASLATTPSSNKKVSSVIPEAPVSTSASISVDTSGHHQFVDPLGVRVPVEPDEVPPSTALSETIKGDFAGIMSNLDNISRLDISASFRDGTIVHARVPAWAIKVLKWVGSLFDPQQRVICGGDHCLTCVATAGCLDAEEAAF
ncbi:unnamed protein product [Notodromas monacha]|uniref:Uncharacterized protein n=1 Tax=Notodromas monacha TaxID=399045 RepID=A0A7R9BXH8_9CRUS|nr:unnamed protein product [Notodromas monacha]CAG0923178.1 unnamed protein product [Notodromas monacha]